MPSEHDLIVEGRLGEISATLKAMEARQAAFEKRMEQLIQSRGNRLRAVEKHVFLLWTLGPILLGFIAAWDWLTHLVKG